MMSEYAKILRPSLPPKILKPRGLETLLYVLYGLMLCLLPTSLIEVLWQINLPMFARVSIALPLAMVSGYGGFMLAVAGHEGFHFTLHSNRYLSGALGIMISSLVPGMFAAGFFASHWEHHRYTNQPSDPDCQTFKRYKTFLSRLFFARLAANRNYIRYTFLMACGKKLHFKYKPPFSLRDMQLFSMFNIACQTIMIGLYLSWAWSYPHFAEIYILVPLAAIVVVGGLSPYQMHAGTGVGVGFDSRTYSSLFWTLLEAGSNFHNEHHLYPRVPCWRLPTVHRILMDSGFYTQNGVVLERRFWAAFKHATSAYQLDVCVSADRSLDEFNERYF